MTPAAVTNHWNTDQSEPEAGFKLGLSLRFLLAGGVLFALLVGLLLLITNHFVSAHLISVYQHKARSIAAAVDASINETADLERAGPINAEIRRCIALNPDLQGLTVFVPQGSTLTALASSHPGMTGRQASALNWQVLRQDRPLFDDAVFERNNKTLRLVAPLHAAGQAMAVVQIDLALHNLQSLRWQILLYSLFGCLPLAIVALVASGFYLRRRVLQPVAELGRGTRDIADGCFDTRIDCESGDEIGLLGRDFNRMASSLERQRQAIIEDKRHYEHQALHDVLTGLPNRAYLQRQFPQYLAVCKRHRRRSALMLLDLDRFKTVNDTFGHSVGDELLLTVAQRLQSILRQEDFVARLGGDEFVVVLSEISSDTDEALYQLKRVVDSLLLNLALPIRIGNNDIQISASVGIAFYPGLEDDLEAIMNNADSAMYEAKNQGGNRACFFDQQMQQLMLNKVNVLNWMPEAINSDQLRIFYQPQVDPSGRVIGAEALVRWMHPLHGMMLPAEFINAIEHNSLSVDMGQWVVENACRQYEDLRRSLGAGDEFSISINISPNHFNQNDFADQILLCLEHFRVDPRCLVLELTEAVLLTDSQELRDRIKRVKQHGIRLSVDDYGTGFSSLTCLQELALDEIKLDGKLVQSAVNSESDRRLIRAIISLSKSLQLNLVAEGVETREQYEFLKAQDCPVFQGQHFQAPQPLSQFDS